jgi:nanoRNase/pAp phosphatase (c-di-AMP/oligoRNAs hydrolase)
MPMSGAGKNGTNGRGASAPGKARNKNGQVLRQPSRLPGPSVVVSRFGPILGKRRARESLPILTQAQSAYMSLRRGAKAIRGRGANVFMQWVADPDALGSAVLLKAILEHLGATQVRLLAGSLGHPQNRKLVERCGLLLQDPNTDRLPRGLHCMVDTSPPLGMSSTGGVEPVSEYFFVADHHADPAEVEENCRARGVKRVKHAYVGLPVGSTSSFMAVIAAAFDEVLESIGAAGRAAAALGIYTDTSALLHGATPLDFKMFELLTRDEATQDILDELRDYRVPADWFAYRGAAFRNQEVTGGVRITPVGYVREEHRDVIAEIASELLRIEGTSIAISVAVTERGTEVSVRADSQLLGDDPTRIVKVVDFLLEHAFPGVSGFKYERRPPHRVEGGACVPAKEEDLRAWRLGSLPPPSAEGDPVLQHCRDCARAILLALRHLGREQPEAVQGLL